MTLKDNNETVAESPVMTGIERLMTALPLSISILLGLSGVAYVIGWFAAKAYFSEFGAQWLVSETPTVALLGFSWLPIVGVAFFSYTGITDLIDSQKEVFSSTRIRNWMSAFILISLGSGLASAFRHSYQSILAYGSALVAVVLAGAAVELAVLYLGTARKNSDASLMHLAWGVIVFCVYMVPTQIGRARALEDLDPNKSALEVVKTSQQDDSKHRLLLINGDRIYTVILEDSSHPAEVRIMPTSTIYSIQRVK